MNNLQQILSSIKDNPLYCSEAIDDLNYGISLGSAHAVQSHFEIWLNYSIDNVNESCQDAAYYRTMLYIFNHNGVMN